MKAAQREVFDAAALGGSPLPPWLLGFQCNERYLQWDSSAQIQLLKIHAAKETGKVRIVFLGRQVLPFSLNDSLATRAVVICSNGLADHAQRDCLERLRRGASNLHLNDLLSSGKLIDVHGQDVRWVEEQLGLLGTLLPDLIAKLPKMKAALLLALVKDTQVESPT